MILNLDSSCNATWHVNCGLIFYKSRVITQRRICKQMLITRNLQAEHFQLLISTIFKDFKLLYASCSSLSATHIHQSWFPSNFAANFSSPNLCFCVFSYRVLCTQKFMWFMLIYEVSDLTLQPQIIIQVDYSSKNLFRNQIENNYSSFLHFSFLVFVNIKNFFSCVYIIT